MSDERDDGLGAVDLGESWTVMVLAVWLFKPETWVRLLHKDEKTIETCFNRETRDFEPPLVLTGPPLVLTGLDMAEAKLKTGKLVDGIFSEAQTQLIESIGTDRECESAMDGDC